MLGTIQRYKAIADAIGKNKKILDVGGGNESISRYAKGYDITSADVQFRGKRLVKTVKASADNLPFKDKSFDIVISVDMLEHLPKKVRKKAVQEMIRVANNKVVLACPCGPEAEKYERKLIKFAARFGKKLPWLEEHQKNGLPTEKEILDAIGRRNVKIIKNENMDWAFILNFIELITRPLQELIGPREMMAIYGPISKIFNFGKCYRRIFIIEK